MELPPFSPDRPGRRSNRYATEQLITPHIPRHTHPSELMVISRSSPRIFIILSSSKWILIRAISRRNHGNKDKLSSIVQCMGLAEVTRSLVSCSWRRLRTTALFDELGRPTKCSSEHSDLQDLTRILILSFSLADWQLGRGLLSWSLNATAASAATALVRRTPSLSPFGELDTAASSSPA
jgi:hypothetical protein